MKRLRIDDIGASTKQYEQYGRKWFFAGKISVFYFPFANWLFFKRIWPFKKWGPYGELTAKEWGEIIAACQARKIKPIIAVTASWVEKGGSLTPFPKKFPEVAEFLRSALHRGEVEIANHGLTHCVVGQHLPRVFKSNREWHREFLPAASFEEHREHIIKSQEILENFFGQPITVLVPPGNVWSFKTARALEGTNLKTIICGRPASDGISKLPPGVSFIFDHSDYIAIHDRELKRGGIAWFNRFLNKHYGR